MDYMIDTLIESVQLTGYIIGLSLLFAYVLTFITSGIKRNIISISGYKGQMYFGFLGIMVHELSHLVFALLFRHKIDRVKLLNFNGDGSLGSVEHSYKKYGVFQRMGNYFIGIAPIYGCTLFLLFLYNFLFQNELNILEFTSNGLSSQPSVLEILQGIQFDLFVMEQSWLYILLFIGVLLNVLIGGYDLSSKDFEGIYSGIIPMVVFLFILISVLGMFLDTGMFVIWVTTLNHVIMVFLSLITALAVFVWVVTKVISVLVP